MRGLIYAVLASLVSALFVILLKHYLGSETTLMIYHYSVCFVIGVYFGNRDYK